MVCWMAAVRAIHMRENAFRDKYERYVECCADGQRTESAKP